MLGHAVARQPAPMLAMRHIGLRLRHGVDALGNAIGESLAAESQPKRDWLAGSGLRLGGAGNGGGSTSSPYDLSVDTSTGRPFSLSERGLAQLDKALTRGDAILAARERSATGGSASVASEVLPYYYLARDGSGHNTPQTAVLVEGRATRDWLDVDDYDALGNRTGFTTSISAAPTTMSYGDQLRNAFWGTGQLAYGGVKGLVNGVPAFVVGTVKGYSYIGAGLRDGFDALVGNRSGNYLDRAIQAGTPYTGEIWSYDNGLQRLGGYGGELLSPAAYSAGLRVGGRLGTAFIDGIGTGPMPGSRSAQRGAIFLGDEGKTFGKLQGGGADTVPSTRSVVLGDGEFSYVVDDAAGQILRAEGTIAGPHVGRAKGALPEPIGGRLQGEHRGHLIPEGGVDNPSFVNIAENLISEAPSSNLGLKKSFNLQASKFKLENPQSLVTMVAEPQYRLGAAWPFAVSYYLNADGVPVRGISIFNR